MRNPFRRLIAERKLTRAKKYLQAQLYEIDWQHFVADKQVPEDEVKHLHDAVELCWRLSWRV